MERPACRAAWPTRRLAVAVRLASVLALLLLGGSAPAWAQQAPLTEVNNRTEVRAIGFRFVETQTFEPGQLREHIALTGRGRLYGIRRALGFLPLVPDVAPHPFSPVELARDAVRLERFYERNGFLFAEADWLVRLDTARNVVTVLFTIEEGPPLILEELVYRGPEGQPAREQFPPALQEEWTQFRARAALQAGERLDELRLIQLREAALSWARNRGYPFASVASRSRVDSVANRAAVTVLLDPGPRARISEVQVEGNTLVRDRVVRRELPFREGDLFSQRRLVDGQREVFGLNIFQFAVADVPQQPEDSLVAVRVRVREADPRALSAQVGYFTESGISGQAEWIHRNFLGDARTFRASVLGNTGLAAIVQDPDRRYRTTLSLRQPYFFDRRVSATGSVFGEFRDDFIDRSRAFGSEATVLYERGTFRNLSVGYRLESRFVQEFRFGTQADDEVSLIEAQLNLGGVATNLSRSELVANATYGQVDDALNPRRGFMLRPSARVTVPFPGTALEYWRLGLTGSAYAPLGRRITLAGRTSLGRLFPLSPEPTDPGEAFSELLRFRDMVFLAGGPTDVRGWPPGRVGPKVLDLIVREPEPGDLRLSAEHFYTYGGTTRATVTTEARFALTELFGVFAFTDAGRIWTPDEAWQVPTDSPLFDGAYDREGRPAIGEDTTDRIFVGAGGGVSITSPIGPIQVALGYKLNPSFFDVVSPRDLAAAFQEVIRADPEAPPAAFFEAAQGVPTSTWRRLHLHLSIGQTL